MRPLEAPKAAGFPRSEASFVTWWAGIGFAVWVFGEGFATLGCCLAYVTLRLLCHTLLKSEDDDA